MDVKNMDVKELKARVYDLMVAVEHCQAEIRQINREIENEQSKAAGDLRDAEGETEEGEQDTEGKG